MNRSDQAFNSTLASLGQSHRSVSVSAEYADVVNPGLEGVKTFANDFGSALTGHVALKGVGKLFRGKAEGSASGLSEEEASALAEATANGDTATASSIVARASARQATARLSQGIQSVKQTISNKIFGSNTNDGEVAETPSSTFESGGLELGSEEASESGGQEAGSAQQSLQQQAESGVRQETEDELGEVAGKEAGEEGGLLAGEESALGASASLDENPVGLAVTAGLGIVTLLTGLFIHSHKKSVVTPAQTFVAPNYSIQAGQ